MTVEIHSHQPSNNGVEFSDAAWRHVVSYLSKTQHQGVRLSVKKTGCSGLSYVIDYVSTPEADDIVLNFDSGHLVCIDKKSYPFLKGTKIDYIREGLNHKFSFMNPNQTGQCGCGESFTID